MRGRVLVLGWGIVLGLAVCGKLTGLWPAERDLGVIPLADAHNTPGDYFPHALQNQKMICYGRNGFFMGMPLLDDYRQNWYAQELSAADEIPLVQLARDAAPGTKLLRFSWLPSFHPSVFILVRKTGEGAYALTAKRLDYVDGYKLEQLDRGLTTDEARLLERRIEQLAGEAAASCESGMDGARWLVEQADQDHYRFMERWSPQDDPVKELGLLLLSFTGWNLDPIY